MFHELRKRGTRERMTRQVAKLVVAVAAILLIAGVIDILLAQGNPFGVPKGGAPKAPPAPPPPPDGVFGWIIAKQNEFYRQFSGLIRQAKADGSAVWGLLGVSFLYGIFHAAGPGHGKAVISAYVVANEETWKRGVVLSFASALLQALVAVAVVGIASALLSATAATMKTAVDVIEIVSYALIVAIGVRLAWVKGVGLVNAWRGRKSNSAAHAHDEHAHDEHAHHGQAHANSGNPGPAHHSHQDHGHHDHAHHAHDHHDHHHHDHHHHDHDDHASAWGHAHAPEPKELAGPGGWTRGLSAIVAVGARPCSGAIIVLVFALAQGLFWAGVAATFVMGLGTAITVAVIATIAVGARSWAARLAGSKSGYGMIAMRTIEVAAAFVIIAFGSLLLTGYLVSERIGV
jgi:nickel/cobalt transporter (NicO) family protein